MTNTAETSGGASDAYKDEYSADLVGKWDMLIDWGNRDAAEARFFIDLLRGYDVRSVLDTAAGTGYHAWVLASAGFAVTASDGAPAMVTRCAQNLRGRGIELPVFEADWRALTAATGDRFDAVVCLGNSFSHLFADADRRAALEQFRAVLNPGGVLVLDHRNYDGILRRGFVEQRTNYCCGADDVVIRAASVSPEVVRLRYEFPDGSGYEVSQSPIRQDDAAQALRDAGFHTDARYGDLHTDYDHDEADFIVHVARAEA